MERGLFIRTQKGPGGSGPNEFMIQWAGIAAAQSSEAPSSMPPSFLSIFIRILIRLIIRILFSSGLEEDDHVLLTANLAGRNGNITFVTRNPIRHPLTNPLCVRRIDGSFGSYQLICIVNVLTVACRQRCANIGKAIPIQRRTITNVCFSKLLCPILQLQPCSVISITFLRTSSKSLASLKSIFLPASSTIFTSAST